MKRLIYALFVLAAVVSCKDEPILIIQIADAQLGFDAAVKGQVPGAEYINDLSYEAAYLEKAVSEINRTRPDFVVFTGDQVHLPADQEQWDLLGAILSGIDPDVRVFHIPGNHDVFLSEGKVDITPFSSRYGEDRFVYNDGKVCIVGINSSLIMHNDPREEEQFEWLKGVLGQSGDKVVKILFCHHPFFLEDIDEDDGHAQIRKAKRKRYFDMFATAGVDAVDAGHLHYDSEGEYRGVPMKTSTSAAYQLGGSEPSYRNILIQNGEIIQDDMTGL